LTESAAIAAHSAWIAIAPFVQTFAEISAFEQSISHGNRTDSIVSVAALVRKQLEIIVIGRIELKPATNYVTNYCS
jgi:hypothetical protein